MSGFTTREAVQMRMGWNDTSSLRHKIGDDDRLVCPPTDRLSVP